MNVETLKHVFKFFSTHALYPLPNVGLKTIYVQLLIQVIKFDNLNVPGTLHVFAHPVTFPGYHLKSTYKDYTTFPSKCIKTSGTLIIIIAALVGTLLYNIVMSYEYIYNNIV